MVCWYAGKGDGSYLVDTTRSRLQLKPCDIESQLCIRASVEPQFLSVPHQQQNSLNENSAMSYTLTGHEPLLIKRRAIALAPLLRLSCTMMAPKPTSFKFFEARLEALFSSGEY